MQNISFIFSLFNIVLLFLKPLTWLVFLIHELHAFAGLLVSNRCQFARVIRIVFLDQFGLINQVIFELDTELMAALLLEVLVAVTANTCD